MFNITMVAILNILTYRKKNRVKGLIISVCRLSAKRYVQAPIGKQAYKASNCLTKDLGTYRIYIHDLAQSNYSCFPAMLQNLEGSRFKNDCQVETVVPLRLII